MYQAIESVDPEKASVNRALAAARAAGARLRDGQAYLWLQPFVELSLAKRKKPEPLPFDFGGSSIDSSGSSSGSSSPSLYSALPDTLPDTLPDALPSAEDASSGGSSSRARVAKVSRIEIQESEYRARAQSARELAAAALTIAFEERCLADDFEHGMWVDANVEAALRLELKYDRDRILLRWRELLVDVAIGRFKATNGISLGLLYTVIDAREAYAASRSARPARPSRRAVADDRFVQQLRAESEGR